MSDKMCSDTERQALKYVETEGTDSLHAETIRHTDTRRKTEDEPESHMDSALWMDTSTF